MIMVHPNLQSRKSVTIFVFKGEIMSIIRSTCIIMAVFAALLTHHAFASIAAHPLAYELQAARGSIGSVPLHITNLGPTSSLSYVVSVDRAWLTLSGLSGTLSVGDTATILIGYDTKGMAPGKYQGTVTVGDPHHGPITIAISLEVMTSTGVDDPGANASDFILMDNYPNPFAASTTVRFRIAQEGAETLPANAMVNATFTVYSESGEILESVPVGSVHPGWNLITLDAQRYSAGWYLGVLTTRAGASSIRMLRVSR
jgi:hypothetical protein